MVDPIIQELPPVEKIDVEIPSDAPLVPVGHVLSIISNLVLVQAENVNDTVLDMDTILLNQEKTPLGRIFEVLGPVVSPIYSVRFNTAQEIKDAGISVGMGIFFIPQLAKFVFTQKLKLLKGSDASNVHDEEIGEDEQEFSDDEAEAAFKQSKKQRKNECKSYVGF